ncbi:probable E3 ubiquitin-protein ligase RHB1A isoform X2 [Vitis riparia]|uniref:probable E3 ubiquitin-protein ligase RHB1A isoform X2 n=1 Tax=Vitis riparia TaxID=96939 RepID=UPI00155A1B39|nr:probable E3 ubiquitin-protein ligase RHB1A isoform X2 [Vitis riparia]
MNKMMSFHEVIFFFENKNKNYYVSFFHLPFPPSFWNFNFILQCPRASEEHEPLSSHHGAASTLSTGLLVDTNLGTSPPDTYRPPPAPIPYDVDLGHPQTPPAAEESCVNKNDTAVQTTNSGSLGEAVEEYDAENPKIVTKCEHHFHLACILEWMERSDTCPVCDKEMIFNTATNA